MRNKLGDNCPSLLLWEFSTSLCRERKQWESLAGFPTWRDRADSLERPKWLEFTGKRVPEKTKLEGGERGEGRESERTHNTNSWRSAESPLKYTAKYWSVTRERTTQKEEKERCQVLTWGRLQFLLLSHIGEPQNSWGFGQSTQKGLVLGRLGGLVG